MGGDGRPAAAQHPQQRASDLREADAGAAASGSSADVRAERRSRLSDRPVGYVLLISQVFSAYT